MGQPKIGIQLYSARHDAVKDLPGTLKKLAGIGFTAVEFFGRAMFTACEVNSALKESGLEICGWHTPWDFVQEGFINAWVAYCKAIGNKYVVVPGLPAEATSTIEKWRETAAQFNAINEKLKKEGMLLGYHNHYVEFKPLNVPGVLPWDAFYEDCCPDIIAQYDIGNSLHGTGINAMEYHKKYIKRSVTVHAKPYSSTVDAAPIGEDEIDWPQYVAEIKKAGVTDYIIVEYEHPDDLYGNLKKCYDTLSRLM